MPDAPAAATRDTAAAAAPHAGASIFDSHAALASASRDSWSHAAATPSSHASAIAATCATAVTALAACPQVGASNFESHAAFATRKALKTAP